MISDDVTSLHRRDREQLGWKSVLLESSRKKKFFMVPRRVFLLLQVSVGVGVLRVRSYSQGVERV